MRHAVCFYRICIFETEWLIEYHRTANAKNIYVEYVYPLSIKEERKKNTKVDSRQIGSQHIWRTWEKRTYIMLISECMTYNTLWRSSLKSTEDDLCVFFVPIEMNSFVFASKIHTHTHTIRNQYRTVINGTLCNLCETKFLPEKQKKKPMTMVCNKLHVAFSMQRQQRRRCCK